MGTLLPFSRTAATAADDRVAICAWCDAEIPADRVCHDGPDTICPACMRADCESREWESERIVMFNEILPPFAAIFGTSIRTEVERLLAEDLTFSETLTIFADLKLRLDRARDPDHPDHLAAEAALHGSRRLLREFLERQHCR